MKCIVFPGQGAQFTGMGKGLFQKYESLVNRSSEILNFDIKELCLNIKLRNQLNNTQFTQPALFLVNYLSYLEYLENNSSPSFLMGHSLGEYNALLASGVFDFETGFRLVKKRGELFSNIKNGGMLAIMGTTEGVIKPFLEHKKVEIANYNTFDQIIVSGDLEQLKILENNLRFNGIKTIPLNVSGAFHSRLMSSAESAFGEYIQNISFETPEIPVLANYSANYYTKENTKKLLVKQITGCVLWKEQVIHMLKKENINFQEIGPGNILTKMINKIEVESTRINLSHLDTLGSISFLKRYNLKKAYVIGGMYKAISSSDLVIRAAKSNLLSFYGAGGISLEETKKSIDHIKLHIDKSQVFGINFLSNPTNPDYELNLADLCLREGVRVVEASAFSKVTIGITYFRIKGIKRNSDETIYHPSRIMAKLSHPEVAKEFLSPPPPIYVEKLRKQGRISEEEAALAPFLSMADDITIESDSGGHTDQKNPFILLPEIVRLKNEFVKKYNYSHKIHIGAAGGIGTPESITASFMLGADYVLTGSINQCTVESGMSKEVKEMLSSISIHDVSIAPAGDMFELGAKVQVVKKGTLFSTRANRLYDLYKQNDSLEQISAKEKSILEKNYFKKTFDEVLNEVSEYIKEKNIANSDQFKKNGKVRMALMFKWYFAQSTRFALNGELERKLDFQIQCGPALGAFNTWVKGSDLEKWEYRHVDVIGLRLMNEAEKLFKKQMEKLTKNK